MAHRSVVASAAPAEGEAFQNSDQSLGVRTFPGEAAVLKPLTQRIERWRRDHDVCAYFNNDREGFFAVRNALRLKERLGV